MNLKEALLSFDGVIDNEYLDQYIKLVNSTISFSAADYTEKYHAIPVSFYYKQRDPDMSYSKYRYQVADKDSRNYLVLLSFKNHCLAHWLLYNCTAGKLNSFMRVAFMKMTGFKTRVPSNLTEADIAQLQQLRNQIIQTSQVYWKPEELEWLINNRAKYSLKECSEILNKSYKAVSHQCNELGITCIAPMQLWTPEEVIYLTNHFANTSAVDIALVLTRHSIGAINYKAWKLGLKKAEQRKPRVYLSQTQKEERNQWLVDNYLINYSRAECAQILDLTKDHLTYLAKELGINNRSKKRYSVKVVCLETEEIFESKSAAMRITGLGSRAMVNAIKYNKAVSSLSNSKYTNIHLQEVPEVENE